MTSSDDRFKNSWMLPTFQPFASNRFLLAVRISVRRQAWMVAHLRARSASRGPSSGQLCKVAGSKSAPFGQHRAEIDHLGRSVLKYDPEGKRPHPLEICDTMNWMFHEPTSAVLS